MEKKEVEICSILVYAARRYSMPLCILTVFLVSVFSVRNPIFLQRFTFLKKLNYNNKLF